jgi:hypothetical protein
MDANARDAEKSVMKVTIGIYARGNAKNAEQVAGLSMIFSL